MPVHARRLVAEAVGQMDLDRVPDRCPNRRPRPGTIDADDGLANAADDLPHPGCLLVELQGTGDGD